MAKEKYWVKSLEHINTLFDFVEKGSKILIGFFTIVIPTLFQEQVRNFIKQHSLWIILILLLLNILTFLLFIFSRRRGKTELNQVIQNKDKHHEDAINKLTAEHEQELRKMTSDFDSRISNLLQVNSKVLDVITENYYRFSRDFRNIINEIESDHKSMNDNESLLIATITQKVRRFVVMALAYLTKIFETLTGEEISACIKIIVGDDFEEINYEDALVKTYERSTNTSSNRMSYHDGNTTPVPMKLNTDFMEIVSNSRHTSTSCFYKGNLLEYDKELRRQGMKYQNTTEDWQNYYIGTVVAPIRIANHHIHWVDKDKDYTILGFLCIDSKSPNAFPPENEEAYCFIMKAFAAILFNVLSKFQYYLKDHQSGVIAANASDSAIDSRKRKNNSYWLKK